MNLNDLFSRKQQVIANMNDLANKVSSGQYTKEQDEEFRKADADLKSIDAQIEILKRQEQLKAEEIVKTGKSDPQPEKKFAEADKGLRASVYKKFRAGENLSENEKEVLNTIERHNNVFEKWARAGFNLNALKAEESEIIKRAQSTSTTAGGYTIPEGFSYEIDKQMQQISELLQYARVYRTATGNDIPWPTNDDTSNTGELLGENSDGSSSSADLVFGQVTLDAYKFSSKMIKVSSELLQDTGIDVRGYLAEQLAERVVKIFNSYATTGTGSSQPLGYMDASAGATQGKVSASATAFTPGELIDLTHSVAAPYRNSRNAAWAMHDLILAEVKKLSFGSSVYFPLWVPSLDRDAPDTILGKPYFVNNAMASTLATGNKIMAFGDWSRFVVRIVNDFSLKVLNERYAEYDQVAFIGLARMDSKILNRNAIKYLELT